MSNYFHFVFKRCFTSKPWSYKEAVAWQNSFKCSSIPQEHISFTFSRSSGAGGQHVNKVSSKAELRLDLNKAKWLPEHAVQNIKAGTHFKISKQNELIITSERTRSQPQNRQDCFDKLEHIIKQAVLVQKEPDQSTLKRVEELRKIEDSKRKQVKKKHSQKKSERRSKGSDY